MFKVGDSLTIITDDGAAINVTIEDFIPIEPSNYSWCNHWIAYGEGQEFCISDGGMVEGWDEDADAWVEIPNATCPEINKRADLIAGVEA